MTANDLTPKIFEFWHKTLISPPPMGEWFMGKYEGDEVMPTYILPGVCISVRMNDNQLVALQHTKGLPAEWRP